MSVEKRNAYNLREPRSPPWSFDLSGSVSHQLVESELQIIFKDYQIIHQILHDFFSVAVSMDVILVNGRIEAAESNFKYRGFKLYIESMEKLTIDLKVTLESLLVQSDSVIGVCQGVGTALIDARNQVFQLTGIASRNHLAVHPQPLGTAKVG